MRRLDHFRKDEDGATMVEMTISIVLLLMLTLGFVDFGHAYYQWNAANKAVQVGARMASISHPVATQIAIAGNVGTPGEPVPEGSYAYECVGGAANCSCQGPDCVVPAPIVAANFNRIFFGDDGACQAGGQNAGRPGMCDFFPRLQPENVVIRYDASGLGYRTRPGGSVPTITVSLQNVEFEFFFLAGLMNFTNITMPPMTSTRTGEDMRSTFP